MMLTLLLMPLTTGALTGVEGQPTTNEESCESSGFESVVSKLSIIKDELRDVKAACGASLGRGTTVSTLTSGSNRYRPSFIRAARCDNATSGPYILLLFVFL